MSHFPKVAMFYLFFFMALLVWITFTCFSRQRTGQTQMDMAKVQQYRYQTQGK